MDLKQLLTNTIELITDQMEKENLQVGEILSKEKFEFDCLITLKMDLHIIETEEQNEIEENLEEEYCLMIAEFASDYTSLSNSIKMLYMEYSGIGEEELLKLVSQYKEEHEKEVAERYQKHLEESKMPIKAKVLMIILIVLIIYLQIKWFFVN